MYIYEVNVNKLSKYLTDLPRIHHKPSCYALHNSI